MLRFMNVSTEENSIEAGKKVENIPVSQIRPNPYQPRKSFSVQGLDELARSIQEYGVIQPITVRKAGNDSYELIAGERRLRACKMLDMDTIPAIVMDSQEQDSAIIALIENLQREDLLHRGSKGLCQPDK